MESAQIGTPLLISSIQYILNVFMTLPALFYVDTWGRRPLMLSGTFGMGSMLFISGALQAVYGQPNTDPSQESTWVIVNNLPVSRAIVACSYIFVALFATTMGPISWIVPGEIFPNKVRAKAVSISTATNWLTNTILAFAVPPLLNSISWRMYLIFGTFNAVAFIHMYLSLPETKNITLEEMDNLFNRKGWHTWGIDGRRSSTKGRSIPLEELERRIAHGEVKVQTPGDLGDNDQKPIMVETVIEMTRQSIASENGSNTSLNGDTKTRGNSLIAPDAWYHAR
jgi:MFS family permease